MLDDSPSLSSTDSVLCQPATAFEVREQAMKKPEKAALLSLNASLPSYRFSQTQLSLKATVGAAVGSKGICGFCFMFCVWSRVF
jgi:hypothetical protein